MSGIQHKAYAACIDTGKTYDLALSEHKGERPQIWQLEVSIKSVESNGYASRVGDSHFFCVERQTLVNFGMLPVAKDDQPQPPETKEKSVEELLVELLARLGLYPAE